MAGSRGSAGRVGVVVRAGSLIKLSIKLSTCVFIFSMSAPASSADALPVRSSTDSFESATDSKAMHEIVEVWVVLSEPALSTLPRDATEQRSALRERIRKQQNDVMAQLVALGAAETGRTQQVSNALAVTLPAAAIEAVKKIDGVIKVRIVTHVNRIND